MEQKSANGAPQTSRSSFGFLPFFCGTAGFGKFSGMFENGQRWGFEYSQDEAGRFYGQARQVARTQFDSSELVVGLNLIQFNS